MKLITYFSLLLMLSIVLAGCQETTPLKPTNPILGRWVIGSFTTYHLPAWYVVRAKSSYVVTPTDTVYSGGALAVGYNIHTLSFKPDSSFTQLYTKLDLSTGQIVTRIDTGRWRMQDSVVALQVGGSFPKKLTYRAASDQLLTDRYAQTTTGQFEYGELFTVSYAMQINYRRHNPSLDGGRLGIREQ